jgi:hypothetical protein
MITDAEHPHYTDRLPDWTLIERMTTGEDVQAVIQQRHFEDHDHYVERKRDADYTPYSRFLISRLTGMLFQRADDVSRISPLTEDDFEEAGPDGEDYLVQLMQLADLLLAYDEVYLIYNPRRGLEVVPPQRVPMWTDQEIVVVGQRVDTSTVFETPARIKTWTRLTPTGYEVYTRVKENGQARDQLIDDGLWGVNEDVLPVEGEVPYFVDPAGRPTAPVVRVRLPGDARFGYLLARKHRSIFEMESRRDFAASAAMNGMLQVGVGDNDELAKRIRRKLIDGASVLPYNKAYGDHRGLSVPTDGIEQGTAILGQKLEEMKRIAHKALEEATRKSATEAQIQHAGGAAAALSVLAITLADAEARILRIWAQARDMRLAGPNPRPVQVSVEWPKDYHEILQTQELIDKVFPAGIPLDAETATQVVMDYLTQQGINDADEDAIRERIQIQLDRNAQAASASLL